MPVVSAGNYVQVDVSIQNVGQQAGTFKISALVTPHGQPASAKVQTFYKIKGYSSTNIAPAGADVVQATAATAVGATTVLSMFTDKWADGNPLKYSSNQVFDVIFTITVVETGIQFTFLGDGVLTHQALNPASPTIVNVVYTVLIS